MPNNYDNRIEAKVVAGVLAGIGLNVTEVQKWTEELMERKLTDMQLIHDGLQYLVLMHPAHAAQALRTLGFSPFVSEVYDVGISRGWLDMSSLSKWGFSLVYDDPCYSDDTDEYLVLLPMVHDPTGESRLVVAEEEEYICQTGARVGPACLVKPGGKEFVQEVSLEMLTDEVKTRVLHECVESIGLSCLDVPDDKIERGDIDSVVDAVISSKSLHGMASGVVEDAVFIQHVERKHVATPTKMPSSPGYGYLALFKSGVWPWVSRELGDCPRVKALIPVYAAAMRRTVVDTGYALEQMSSGIYKAVQCADLTPGQVMAGMVLAVDSWKDSVVLDSNAQDLPFVYYRGNAYTNECELVQNQSGFLEYVPLVVGDAVKATVGDGRFSKVDLPAGARLLLPGGQELYFAEGAKLVSVGGVRVAASVKGKSHGLRVEVGDDFDRRCWFHRYAGFVGEDTAARFISRVGVELVVSNFTWEGKSYEPSKGKVIALQGDDILSVWGGEVPRGVEVAQVIGSTRSTFAVDGCAFSVKKGKAILTNAADVRVSNVAVTMRAGVAPVAFVTSSRVLCLAEQGAVVAQLSAVDAYELDDGGPEDGFFEDEFVE